MTHRPKAHLSITLLTIGLTFALAASAYAQQRYESNRVSGSLQINFGTAPHWTPVSGTHVEVIREGERPDYDMFHYGNDYYVYQNDQLYRSNQWRGTFTGIDARSVPNELSMVPRENWRRYPTAWQDRNRGPEGSSATLQINLGSQPRWTNVRGTRVRMIRGQRPDYDMFRYGNYYYVYNNDRWFMSRQWRGEFSAVDDRQVPRELARVPRQHWRNYPQSWANDNGDRRYDNNRRRH
jgi:hypothetical protein